MKLGALREMPVFHSWASVTALESIVEYQLHGDIQLRHGEVRDWVFNQVDALNKTRVLKETEKKITGYSAEVNGTVVDISLFTKYSLLEEVRILLQCTLNTTSKISELKGKKDLLTGNYAYKISVDTHSGDYDRRGKKIPSDGAIRLLVLFEFLERVFAKNRA